MNSIKTLAKAVAATIILGSIFGSNSSQAATPYVMSSGNYLESFQSIGTWANDFASGTGAAPWSSVPVTAGGTIPDGIKTTVSTATFQSSSSSSTGIERGTNSGTIGITNFVFLTTGTSDNSTAIAVDLNLDFTGRNAGTLSYDWSCINNGISGNRASTLRIYTSTDGSTWSELTDATIFVTNLISTSGSISSVALPASFNGASTAKIRFYQHNGPNGSSSGSRPKIAIDNVAVTSTGASGSPPVITGITPSTVTTNAGSTVQFSVTSTGDAPTYFWYKETASTTNLIPDATTATLTLTNVLATDTASYQVILTNASGADTSAVVSLTVTDPAINTQPVSSTRLIGGSATFTVVAGGTPTLNYQWYSKPTSDNFDFSGAVALSNIGNISGAGSNTLTITNLAYADATNLFVVVTGGAGSITSSVVALTVASTTSLAYWNFNGSFLNVTSPVPAMGDGIAAILNCSGFSNNVYSGLDFDFNLPAAWGTQNYPAAGVSNKTAGVQFKTSTLGAKNIRVTFDTRVSPTSSEYQRLQYTTNGTDYLDYFASSSFASANLYESRSMDLTGFPGVDNNTNFAIRIVSEFESTALYGTSANDQYVGVSSTYASSGTLSYDIVNITGDAITNANTAPTITSFTNVVTADTDSSVVLNFTVGDAETAAGSLTVTAISSNQMVMPDGDLVLGGSGASRTLTLNPNGNALGVAPILVKVTDGDGDTTTTWFYVTVEPGNQPPTISGLVNTNTLGNTINTYSFNIGDDTTAVGSLVTAVSSGNSTLVPNDIAHIYTTGSGSTRTVTVIPATDKYGVAPILVTVDDGAKTSTNSFYLMVTPNTVTLLDDAFDYDTGGSLINQSLALWNTHSGTPGQMQVGSGVVTVTDGNSEDVNALLIGQPYTSSKASALYARFTLNFTSLPTTTNTYFAHFINGTSTFYSRIYASTAFATAGTYRIGVANGSATGQAQQIPQDLSLGANYTLVCRLDMTTGASTIWIDPTSETSPGLTNSTGASVPTVAGFALRESPGESTLTIDNLRVAMNFLSAVSNIVDIPPQAYPDVVAITENSKTNQFTPLTNDVLNLPQGALAIASVSATNGTATVSADKQKILYTPATSFAGVSTINYTITDGFGGLSTSTITASVAALTPIPVSLQTINGSVILNWSGPGFFLQSATNVAGPYVTIPGATSPYTNLIGTNAAQFYRLSD